MTPTPCCYPGFITSSTAWTATPELAAARHSIVRQGILLSYATIGYNSLEAIGSLIAGLLSGSVALVGFGIDSVIEVIASVAAQWRLRVDADLSRRFSSEVRTLRIVGWCFHRALRVRHRRCLEITLSRGRAGSELVRPHCFLFSRRL